MNEIIARGNIQVGQHAATWEEAIRVAAAPLLERGSIECGYVDRMIASVHELGPYMVIMPGFALAHAAPGPDVRASELSVATFDDDIAFNSANDPVRVVMCLACKDSTAHIARLQNVAEKLLEDGFLDQMLACGNEEALYQLVNA